jgi:hypothetical protein
VGLNKVLDSAVQRSEAQAAQKEEKKAEKEKSGVDVPVAKESEFASVLKAISGELLKLGGAGQLVQWVGGAVMFFAGDRLSALLEQQMAAEGSIDNDIWLVEYVTEIFRDRQGLDDVEAFSEDFYNNQLQEKLQKILPSEQRSQKMALKIAESLTKVLKSQALTEELIYYYILPQFV